MGGFDFATLMDEVVGWLNAPADISDILGMPDGFWETAILQPRPADPEAAAVWEEVVGRDAAQAVVDAPAAAMLVALGGLEPEASRADLLYKAAVAAQAMTIMVLHEAVMAGEVDWDALGALFEPAQGTGSALFAVEGGLDG